MPYTKEQARVEIADLVAHFRANELSLADVPEAQIEGNYIETLTRNRARGNHHPSHDWVAVTRGGEWGYTDSVDASENSAAGEKAERISPPHMLGRLSGPN
jgi:hypothetical protein